MKLLRGLELKIEMWMMHCRRWRGKGPKVVQKDKKLENHEAVKSILASHILGTRKDNVSSFREKATIKITEVKRRIMFTSAILFCVCENSAVLER